MEENNKGFKIIIGILLVILLVIIGIIVANVFLKDKTNNALDNNTNINDINENEDSNENKNDNKENVLKVPAAEIYFTYPKEWYLSSKSATEIVQESEDALVGISYNWDFEGSLEDMISYMSKSFLFDAASRSRGILGAYPIEVIKTEETKIAGYDSIKFIGKVNNNGEWDCHVYGYTYVVDGTNLMVIGLVSTQAQDPKMIKEIDELTDQIAASVSIKK